MCALLLCPVEGLTGRACCLSMLAPSSCWHWRVGQLQPLSQTELLLVLCRCTHMTPWPTSRAATHHACWEVRCCAGVRPAICAGVRPAICAGRCLAAWTGGLASSRARGLVCCKGSRAWLLPKFLPREDMGQLHSTDGFANQLLTTGEAAMWSEHLRPAILDYVVWPRAAAVAERLWSPANATQASGSMRLDGNCRAAPPQRHLGGRRACIQILAPAQVVTESVNIQLLLPRLEERLEERLEARSLTAAERGGGAPPPGAADGTAGAARAAAQPPGLFRGQLPIRAAAAGACWLVLRLGNTCGPAHTVQSRCSAHLHIDHQRHRTVLCPRLPPTALPTAYCFLPLRLPCSGATQRRRS